MEVWWILSRISNGATEITISHDMPASGNALLDWFRQKVVGNFFVHNIAAKTLAAMKIHLEAS